MRTITYEFSLFSLNADGKPHVMLVGGRGIGAGNANELKEPWFFTLDANDPPPDCLNGTKNVIDGNVRRRPALIKTEGRSKFKVFISRHTCSYKMYFSDNKPLTCSSSVGNCMIYDVSFPICRKYDSQSHLKT